LEEKNLIVVEYPDGSSVVYEVPKEVETIEDVTSEVFEQWNVKVRNRDGTYSWLRIRAPSKEGEVVIRSFDGCFKYKIVRSRVKKDPVTRNWVK